MKINEKKKKRVSTCFVTAMPFFCGPGLAPPRPKQHIHVTQPVQQCEVVSRQFADVGDKQKWRKEVKKGQEDG